MAELEFWFELGSTYSYPAAMRIAERAEQSAITVRWRSFLLGPIFRDQGWDDSPFNLYPAKGRYMWRDLERICDAEGIPFRRPSRFPRNGLRAARIACRCAEEPWLPGFVREIYRANFEHDLEISDDAVIERCLVDAGASADGILAQGGAEEAKAQLRQRTEEAARRGIFGAPSFWVDGELFWGYDRLTEALAWAKRGVPAPPG